MEEKYAKIMKDIAEMKKWLYNEIKNYVATLTVEQKLQLAKDQNTTVFVLKVLGEDPDPEVSAVARKKLNEILRH